eukprot:2507838-Alexandrium_andersonii.AAC.1
MVFDHWGCERWARCLRGHGGRCCFVQYSRFDVPPMLEHPQRAHAQALLVYGLLEKEHLPMRLPRPSHVR